MLQWINLKITCLTNLLHEFPVGYFIYRVKKKLGKQILTSEAIYVESTNTF